MKSIFEIAKSGLQSSERSLSVTSNNIINADTPGYSRQRVEKSPREYSWMVRIWGLECVLMMWYASGMR